MLEMLKGHSAKVGVHAIIMSPTRELALQTLKFAKNMKKHTDLRTAVVLGGDSMDKQVSGTLAANTRSVSVTVFVVPCCVCNGLCRAMLCL